MNSVFKRVIGRISWRDRGGFRWLASNALASSGGFLTKIVKSTLQRREGVVSVCNKMIYFNLIA
jgi:hypothetical protein